MTWIWIVLFLCVAMIAGGLFLRSAMAGGSIGGGLFGPKPDRRLEVIEQASVDSRRRLIIVRRDNVEHLIMTGGPVDVVIETGIGATATRPRPAIAAEPSTGATVASFGRAARTTSQAAGE
jgi:flagellar protein FliO/FliZ